jgi:hypothetical protein
MRHPVCHRYSTELVQAVTDASRSTPLNARGDPVGLPDSRGRGQNDGAHEGHLEPRPGGAGLRVVGGGRRAPHGGGIDTLEGGPEHMLEDGRKKKLLSVSI